jgi:hypothetical protein
MMEIFRMNKKGYLAKSDPEVDRIYTEWLEKFEKTRAIRKEIKDAEARLAKASAEFLEVHHYWEAYEKENGASR